MDTGEITQASVVSTGFIEADSANLSIHESRNILIYF